MKPWVTEDEWVFIGIREEESNVLLMETVDTQEKWWSSIGNVACPVTSVTE